MNKLNPKKVQIEASQVNGTSLETENQASDEDKTKSESHEETDMFAEKKSDKKKFQDIIKNIKELRKIQRKEKILRDFSKLFSTVY